MPNFEAVQTGVRTRASSIESPVFNPELPRHKTFQITPTAHIPFEPDHQDRMMMFDLLHPNTALSINKMRIDVSGHNQAESLDRVRWNFSVVSNNGLLNIVNDLSFL